MKRKSEWEQQLPMVKLTNLLLLRDALMVTACIHMMRLEVGECTNAQLSHMTVRWLHETKNPILGTI